MNPASPERGFKFTLAEGKVDTIRGTTVPTGLIVSLGLAGVEADSREITPRAIQLTAGIFEFAERSDQLDPSGKAK